MLLIPSKVSFCFMEPYKLAKHVNYCKSVSVR